MNWKDQLRPASFRGVEFFVMEPPSAGGGGRRVVEHQFPGGDFAKYEDNGRNARKFTLSCYIWGDDYVTKRDKVEDAFDQEGYGTLVHPTRGEMECLATISDAVEEGGVCTWNVEFSVKQTPASLVKADWSSRLGTAGAEAAQSANENFKENFSASESSRLVSTATRTANELFDSLDEAMSAIAEVIEAGDQLKAAIESIKSRVDSLVRDAALYANEISSLFGLVQGDVPPKEATRIFRNMFQDCGYFYPYEANTPVRRKEIANTNAQRIHMRSMIVSQLAGVMANDHFNSHEAQTSLSDFNSMIKSLLSDAIQDTEMINNLRDLRGSVNKAMESLIEKMPSVHTMKLIEPMPASLVVYQLYGNLDHEEEFLRLNNITHPAFIQGEIKWLSYA